MNLLCADWRFNPLHSIEGFKLLNNLIDLWGKMFYFIYLFFINKAYKLFSKIVLWKKQPEKLPNFFWKLVVFQNVANLN